MFLVALMATAGPVSKQQALAKANEFLSSRGLQVAGGALRAPGQNTAADNQPLYVFNTAGNKGFVIIAGDDRAETLLGYTETGSYDEDNMPDNFRSWLEQTAKEISSMTDTGNRKASSRPRCVASHSAISPLIKTKWNQGNPTESGYIYNTLTPTINSKHCYTGCVATAGAQVMNYYQYPKNATKTVPGYTPNSTIGALSDLPSIKFDWANMKNTYSSSDVGTKSEKAVSQLMLYAGYAALMNYGLGGSGASEYNLAKGMAEYFDYDPYTWKSVARSSYSINEWDALIYGELQAKRPVIYTGSGISGHAFICDGYNGEGLYHFNWGWGGYCDGYFKLHATNPEGGNSVYEDGTIDNGYTMNITAIVGLQPNTGQVPSGDTTDDLVATSLDPSISGNVISAYLQNNNSVTAKLALGIAELNSDGTITVLDKSYQYYANWELPTGYYWTNPLSFDVSEYNLSKGTHYLVFASLSSNSSEWKRCKPEDVIYKVVVGSGGITITQVESELQVKKFNFTGNKYATIVQPVEVTVECQGIDCTKPLYFFASTSSSSKGTAVFSTGTAIEVGQSEIVTFYFNPSKAGKYYVWVCTDEEGNNVIGSSNVTISAAPTYKVTLTNVNVSVDANNKTTVTVRVKNNTSYKYYESFLAYLETDDDYVSQYTPVYLINPGETKDITMTFYDIEPDTNYYFSFYYRPYVGGNYYYLCRSSFSYSTPAAIPGDVNMDGVLDINDITLIVEKVLTGNDPTGYHNEYADLDNDNNVSVNDVNILVQLILN